MKILIMQRTFFEGLAYILSKAKSGIRLGKVKMKKKEKLYTNKKCKGQKDVCKDSKQAARRKGFCLCKGSFIKICVCTKHWTKSLLEYKLKENFVRGTI